MRYWLMKSEPNVFSIDDLAAARNQTEPWTGVRNFQARNFMRYEMTVGDPVLFYHSSCPEPGIAGIAEVAKLGYPDATQFDPKSEYYEPKATREKPYWYNVEVKFVKKTRLLSLQELRSYPELAGMRLLKRGNRLSILPIEPKEWEFILGKLEL
jgi:predicted RNA-binding protein with PUA-like domain